MIEVERKAWNLLNIWTVSEAACIWADIKPKDIGWRNDNEAKDEFYRILILRINQAMEANEFLY